MKRRFPIEKICLVLVAVMLVYLFHDIFKENYTAYNTETTNETVVQETLDLKGFVIRDEQYISGESQGTVVPLVSDGNRVASGDAVARVCNSVEDASDFTALIDAKRELERYEELSKQTELNALDMEKLNNEIDKCYTELLADIASGNYSDTDSGIKTLEDRLASKQILSKGNIDLSAKFTELNAEIARLEAKNIKTEDVAAPLSGYYISNIDGYENKALYSDVPNLTVEEIKEMLDSTPDAVTNKMGKIVGSYKWYIAAYAPDKYESSLPVGKTVRINIPYYGIEGVSAVVEKASSDGKGEIALILSCNMMNETYANMRIESFEIVLDEHKGYKINSAAIRDESDSDGNNVKVVYILRGNIMNARKIEIIYDAGDYVIASEETQAGGGYKPVRLYDEVIVKGRNLSDGKSVS